MNEPEFSDWNKEHSSGMGVGVPANDYPDTSMFPVATATAIPIRPAMMSIDPTSFRRSSILTALNAEQLAALQHQGFPKGLAMELGYAIATYPIRFWIVDNSGSMRTPDGHQLWQGARDPRSISHVHANNNRSSSDALKLVRCTRWAELQSSVQYHVHLAGILKATTYFRLLNDPGARVGPQEFSVAEEASKLGNPGRSIHQDITTAIRILDDCQPKGVTPLTEHLLEIRSRIQQVEHVLRSLGQQAVIVIATDGLPSDRYGESSPLVQKEFVDALRSLQTLPVWVVVRLCTDDTEVVNYYNHLDSILELPLEVIDDFLGEGREIYAENKWLNYALPLHRCREMGYHHRIFDILDERTLTKDELREFLALLFGASAIREAPSVHGDWKGFVDAVSHIVKLEGKQWNPNTKRVDWWVDVKQLRRMYDEKKFRLFGRKKAPMP